MNNAEQTISNLTGKSADKITHGVCQYSGTTIIEGMKKFYNTGLEVGKNEGFKKGVIEGYKKGVEIGYKNGFLDGKNKGIGLGLIIGVATTGAIAGGIYGIYKHKKHKKETEKNEDNKIVIQGD